MSAPNSRFRDSAAVVLLHGSGPSLEVFWVKRSEAVSYMPGFHAFLGGKTAPEDRELEITGAASEEDRMIRACALRESFEECGVLLGLETPASLAPPVLHDARRRLLAGEATFAALAREHGWRFRADALVFAGRWSTPPFASMRFDTAFFIARVPEGQEPSIVPGELASGEWIAPREALESWRHGEATFAAPILYTLRALGEGDEALPERLARAPLESAQPVRRIELSGGSCFTP